MKFLIWLILVVMFYYLWGYSQCILVLFIMMFFQDQCQSSKVVGNGQKNLMWGKPFMLNMLVLILLD
ncbi:Uncharacterised protein [Chlamydia trachomatis]|nr:Uncharacterised protein [Chlamydia trachomatis]